MVLLPQSNLSPTKWGFPFAKIANRVAHMRIRREHDAGIWWQVNIITACWIEYTTACNADSFDWKEPWKNALTCQKRWKWCANDERKNDDGVWWKVKLFTVHIGQSTHIGMLGREGSRKRSETKKIIDYATINVTPETSSKRSMVTSKMFV